MGGSDHGHGGGHGGKKYSIPEAYKQEHPHDGYAGKGEWAAEKGPSPFWHPPPKDMPEAPVHFDQNPVNLEIHLGDPRHRLAGMTEAERAWRKKYVQAQHLAPEEPVYIPEFHGNFNPLRRIYRYPWDRFEAKVLIPKLGMNRGHHVRMIVPKLILSFFGIAYGYYHIKYNHPTWLESKRTHVMPMISLLKEEEIDEKHPGLKEKALKLYKNPKDYHEYDFKLRTSHLDLEPPNRP